MERKLFLLSILFLSFSIAALHYAALVFYLYWLFFWFDLMMHFLGGFLIALISAWGMFYFVGIKPLSDTRKSTFLYLILFVTLVVAIGWEVFEFLTGLRPGSNYLIDTLTDLVIGLLGAMGAYFVIRSLHFRGMLQ